MGYTAHPRPDLRRSCASLRFRCAAHMEVYDGDWDDGLRHGHGLLRFADGSFYQGDFLRERKHGTGCMVWVDGSQYQGRYFER